MPNEHYSTSSFTTKPAEATDYRILKGHERTDGSYKTDEQLRMEYIHRTDDLIYKMTHGVDVIDPITHERTHEIPDTVIFLDKSARPLAWGVRELWDKLALTDDSQIADQPDFKFLNIDRKQWVNTLDPQGNGILDITRIDDSIIRSLRSIFIKPNLKTEGLTDKIDDTPSSLDNRVILVVDEVFSTGRTLSIAEDLIGRAFPTAKIAGAHWMAGVSSKELAMGNSDIPVWYKKDDPTGRGVNDRLKNPSGSEFKNITQKLGAWFLSTRFATPDLDALQLRKEWKMLASDDTIPVRLSSDRYDLSSDDEYERFVAHTEKVNYGKYIKDITTRVREINQP